jgi:hypothetical protein
MKKTILKILLAKPFRKYTRPMLGARRRNFFLKMLPKHSVGAEVGVNEAGFSRQIMKVVKPTKLYLIDPYIDKDELYNKVSKNLPRNLSIIRKKSEEALNDLENSSLDWTYLDGDHTYEAVKTDLKLSWDKVKKGGLITGDNYHYAGDWDDGVRVAVNEFIGEKNPKVLLIAKDQFIIEKS